MDDDGLPRASSPPAGPPPPRPVERVRQLPVVRPLRPSPTPRTPAPAPPPRMTNRPTPRPRPRPAPRPAAATRTGPPANGMRPAEPATTVTPLAGEWAGAVVGPPLSGRRDWEPWADPGVRPRTLGRALLAAAAATVAPGSGHLVLGHRRAGAAILGVFLAALAALGFVATTVPRSSLIQTMLSSRSLVLGALVCLAVALAWIGIICAPTSSAGRPGSTRAGGPSPPSP